LLYDQGDGYATYLIWSLHRALRLSSTQPGGLFVLYVILLHMLTSAQILHSFTLVKVEMVSTGALGHGGERERPSILGFSELQPLSWFCGRLWGEAEEPWATCQNTGF
jgi:hypothetical protein